MGAIRTIAVTDGKGGRLVINEKDFVKGKHKPFTTENVAAEKKAVEAAEKRAAEKKAVDEAEKGGKG